MTRQDAIDVLMPYKERLYNLQGTQFDAPQRQTNYLAYSMAIEALQKQIPQKPESDVFTSWCLNCGYILGDMNYCHDCGQRIKWD